MQDVLIIPSAEFCRQSKRLAKKYKSLKNDLLSLQLYNETRISGKILVVESAKYE